MECVPFANPGDMSDGRERFSCQIGAAPKVQHHGSSHACPELINRAGVNEELSKTDEFDESSPFRPPQSRSRPTSDGGNHFQRCSPIPGQTARSLDAHSIDRPLNRRAPGLAVTVHLRERLHGSDWLAPGTANLNLAGAFDVDSAVDYCHRFRPLLFGIKPNRQYYSCGTMPGRRPAGVELLQSFENIMCFVHGIRRPPALSRRTQENGVWAWRCQGAGLVVVSWFEKR